MEQTRKKGHRMKIFNLISAQRQATTLNKAA